MMWEFGKIPLEILIAIAAVLLIEAPIAWFIANQINDLIEWIKDHETE